jgi:exopolysaccharide production protein ExoQ
MSRILAQRVVRTAEFVYAALALFALTQGPVYRLWSESGEYQQLIALPAIGQAYFATFVLVQLPGCLLWFRSVTERNVREPRMWMLVGLLAWLGASVMWSTFARHAVSEFIALAVTTGFGLYLATRFAMRDLWRIVAAAMAVGLAMSLLAIQRDWQLAVNVQDDYWIGIYYNRNSLAPVAAMALLAFIGMVSTTLRRRTIDVAVLAAGVALAGVAALVLWRAQSRTSPLALGVASGALVLWLLVRLITQRISVARRWHNLAAPIAVTVSAVAVFVALRTVGGLASVSGETATFNSRGGLWAQNWVGFLEKPWQGWGWMAARRTPQFDLVGEWWIVIDTEWSHNGYHDLLLGGGVLAGILFVGVVFFGVRSLDQIADVRMATPQFLVIGFVLAAATQESFFIGSHFLWAMLIAALFAGSATRADESVEPAANYSVNNSVNEQNARH